MKLREIEQQLKFYQDAMYMVGFQMGYESVVNELDALANSEWNMGNKVTSEVIRKVIQSIEEGKPLNV